MLYTANFKFKDLKANRIYEVGEQVDVTVERAKEIEKNITSVKGYEKFKLTRVKEKE